jgi:DNA-binding transcriptional LysR family regulator
VSTDRFTGKEQRVRPLIEESLYYFSVVAQSGSLTAATDKLGITISALSRHITKLEREVGIALFERHARGMELSRAGRLLFRHAQRSLNEAEALMNEMRGEQQRLDRKVSIACTEGFALDFLPVSISGFQRMHPEARIEIHVTSSAGASQQLVDGNASIALGFSLKPEQGVSVRHSMAAPVMALMRSGHPLAARTVLKLRDIVGFPLLLQDQTTTIRQLVEIACNVEGVEIVAPVTSHYVAALYRFIQIMPEAVMFSGYLSVARRLKQDGLVARPIDNAVMQERRLQVKTLAGQQLQGLADECLNWLIKDLERTQPFSVESAPRRAARNAGAARRIQPRG